MCCFPFRILPPIYTQQVCLCRTNVVYCLSRGCDWRRLLEPHCSAGADLFVLTVGRERHTAVREKKGFATTKHTQCVSIIDRPTAIIFYIQGIQRRQWEAWLRLQLTDKVVDCDVCFATCPARCSSHVKGHRKSSIVAQLGVDWP